jgi:hypothetical protein
MIAGERSLVLLRDGGCPREGVARRSWPAGGNRAGRGLLTSLIYLMNQQTESQSVPSLGLIQRRRSIKGSETPQAGSSPGPCSLADGIANRSLSLTESGCGSGRSELPTSACWGAFVRLVVFRVRALRRLALRWRLMLIASR